MFNEPSGGWRDVRVTERRTAGCELDVDDAAV